MVADYSMGKPTSQAVIDALRASASVNPLTNILEVNVVNANRILEEREKAIQRDISDLWGGKRG